MTLIENSLKWVSEIKEEFTLFTSKIILYVDTENRQPNDWLPIARNLRPMDEIVLLHTEKSYKFTVPQTMEMINLKCDIKEIEAFNGTPNALDFVLVAALAQRCATAKQSLHLIVSADKGFDSAVNYLATQYKVKRISERGGFCHYIREQGYNIVDGFVEPITR